MSRNRKTTYSTTKYQSKFNGAGILSFSHRRRAGRRIFPEQATVLPLETREFNDFSRMDPFYGLDEFFSQTQSKTENGPDGKMNESIPQPDKFEKVPYRHQ